MTAGSSRGEMTTAQVAWGTSCGVSVSPGGPDSNNGYCWNWLFPHYRSVQLQFRLPTTLTISRPRSQRSEEVRGGRSTGIFTHSAQLGRRNVEGDPVCGPLQSVRNLSSGDLSWQERDTLLRSIMRCPENHPFEPRELRCVRPFSPLIV